jgi:hypothetical protein
MCDEFEARKQAAALRESGIGDWAVRTIHRALKKVRRLASKFTRRSMHFQFLGRFVQKSAKIVIVILSGFAFWNHPRTAPFTDVQIGGCGARPRPGGLNGLPSQGIRITHGIDRLTDRSLAGPRRLANSAGIGALLEHSENATGSAQPFSKR